MMPVANNKFALITGGSSGIGLAIAHELAAKGYNLLLVSDQADQLKLYAAELSQRYKINCLELFADLSDPGSAKRVYDHCHSHSLDVEILVNNAGILVFSEVVATPENKVQTIMNLHMYTPVMLCRLFGEDMKKNKRGFILNVSSISSVMPYPGISLYGPTKTFLRYFSRALRQELKPFGVIVTCVLPGATETGLYDPEKVNLKLAKRLGVMQDAGFVARKTVDALFQNNAESIPGLLNKLTVCVLPFVPAFVIQLIHRNTNWIKKGEEALG